MGIHQKFGQNVKRYRLARQWSQEELAAECGLHRTYISGIERGRRNPTLSIITLVAKALGLSLSELLEEKPRQ